jgi:MerR family transcriptional regulator, light-induced transcriptional regulator
MTSSPSPIFSEETYRGYLAGLVAGDRQSCRRIFEECLTSCQELRVLYQSLVERSLYEVGELWERNQISVATEHLATAITESLLNLVYPRLFGHLRGPKSALVTCAANELHQIGGKMVADIFELNGWRGYFLGANTPLPDLQAFIQEKRPDVVAFSGSIASNLDQLIGTVMEIRAAFPDVSILVGGQAFRWGGRERIENQSGVLYLNSLDELETWIRTDGRHD